MGQIPDLHELAAGIGRYDVEAFCFVSQGLRHAAKLHRKDLRSGTERHLAAPQLVDGVLDLAAERFGLLAHLVLSSWGLRCSEDIGSITFALIENKVFSKQPSDRIEDFYGGPDFVTVLEERVRSRLGVAASS
jgi:uncharacterized repeat protein (TIGR04138 family)